MALTFSDNIPPLKDAAPVIVIGSGIAGLYCALELSRKYPVILITKADLSESNTTYAQGGIAAAVGLHDAPELHYQDTIMAGAGLCNSEAVLALVYDGPKRVRHLIDLGVDFDRAKDGGISLTREAAHSRRRILHADGDATGRGISRTLVKLIRESSSVRIYEHTFALALATRENQCRGVVTLRDGHLDLFLAEAVVLCSGGLGQIFGKTTNPDIATGSGYSLAFNGGAALRDMEFIQFHPTALHLPPAPPFLISEAVRGEGAILRNSAGDRFMPGYHDQAELAPRDVVARAIYTELTKHPDSCVYLDLAKIDPATVKTRFPNIYETCLNYGLDITKSPIPVAPAAHYMMGGVGTDLWGRTTLPGLYAAGEVAATGVHGANRLASNSLLEGLVFGGRIADHLEAMELRTPKALSDLTIHYPQCLTDPANIGTDFRTFRQITDHFLGIVRRGPGLEEAVAGLSQLEQSYGGQDAGQPVFAGAIPDADAQVAYLEFQMMLQLAVLVARAALTRSESRGGHFRADFPTPDNLWRKHIVFQRKDPAQPRALTMEVLS